MRVALQRHRRVAVSQDQGQRVEVPALHGEVGRERVSEVVEVKVLDLGESQRRFLLNSHVKARQSFRRGTAQLTVLRNLKASWFGVTECRRMS
jgi:hypothetical protein